MSVRTAALNASLSNSPSSRTNFIKLIDARLQAESSRNMYSEQGLLALIRAVFGQVCQSFTVVSNWSPGSPQMCVASAICRISARALYVPMTSPLSTARALHSPSPMTARRKSAVTRALLFGSWKNSGRVTDDFMRAVIDDGEWNTRAVLSGDVMGTYRARALMRQIAEATHI